MNTKTNSRYSYLMLFLYFLSMLYFLNFNNISASSGGSESLPEDTNSIATSLCNITYVLSGPIGTVVAIVGATVTGFMIVFGQFSPKTGLMTITGIIIIVAPGKIVTAVTSASGLKPSVNATYNNCGQQKI